MKYIKLAKDIGLGLLSLSAISFVSGVIIAGLVKLFLLGWHVIL